jgi:dipeptidyl aminopeptidase/acylaminoacyl peptidase
MFMNRTRWIAVVAAALSISVLVQAPATAQTIYQLPPKVVVDILDAKPLPSVTISPTHTVMALADRASMPTIVEMSQPMLRLAGTRINPRTTGPQRSQGILAITLKRVADGKEIKVTVPLRPSLGNLAFSPDGRRLAFTQTLAGGIELWMTDAATGAAKAITTPTLNGTYGAPCDWVSDKEMLCRFVVTARGPAPAAPAVPAGPNIQENEGKAAPVSTYQDLLRNEQDEALFEYYFRSQVAFVNVATGVRTPVGKPGIFEPATISPDGRFLLVARTKRPFSRLVPASEFAKDVEVWDRQGQVVRKIADLPLAETTPINGVATGPRQYRWHPLDPATLIWVEALDKGDLRNKVANRDRLLVLKAPFTGEPAEALKLQYRYGGISWTDKGVALVSESDRDTRTTRTWLVDTPTAQPRKLWDRKIEDRYKDPGRPLMRPRGADMVILQAGDAIYLTGEGSSPQGDRPFLDRLNLQTLVTERLFQSDERSYESVMTLLSDDAKTFITRWETAADPPNYYLRDRMAGTKKALTTFKEPQPQLKGIERQFVTYDRKDGVKLSGTLYLPAGYQKGQRLPLVMWAYPREFTDAGAASQVTGSRNRLMTVSGASHLLLLTQGYAIFDDPKMPIIGPGETANDTYVDQLIASAQAAVDKVVEMGVADRDRIGVGGHSYGAFMTANLLAHSRLFRAGVARSGAYNRTLTPFGFQSERRTFWEVPQIYANMSPFWYADKIKDPILLIHGEADNNSGTFPIQSERFYMALKGHGATVRYVTLPNEAHGYAARESNFHVLAEMIAWLDKYVKNAGPRTTQ